MISTALNTLMHDKYVKKNIRCISLHIVELFAHKLIMLKVQYKNE